PGARHAADHGRLDRRLHRRLQRAAEHLGALYLLARRAAEVRRLARGGDRRAQPARPALLGHGGPARPDQQPGAPRDHGLRRAGDPAREGQGQLVPRPRPGPAVRAADRLGAHGAARPRARRARVALAEPQAGALRAQLARADAPDDRQRARPARVRVRRHGRARRPPDRRPRPLRRGRPPPARGVRRRRRAAARRRRLPRSAAGAGLRVLRPPRLRPPGRPDRDRRRRAAGEPRLPDVDRPGRRRLPDDVRRGRVPVGAGERLRRGRRPVRVHARARDAPDALRRRTMAYEVQPGGAPRADEIEERVDELLDDALRRSDGACRVPDDEAEALGRSAFDTPSSKDGTVTVLLPKESIELVPSQALVRIVSKEDDRSYLGIVVEGPFAEPDGLRADAPLVVQTTVRGAILMPRYHGRVHVELLGEELPGGKLIPPRYRPLPNSPVFALGADETAAALRLGGELRLGRVVGNEQVEVAVPIGSKEVLPRHTAILGTTGGGKSTTVAGLVAR